MPQMIRNTLIGAGLGLFAGYKLGEYFEGPKDASFSELKNAYIDATSVQRITFSLFLLTLSPIVLQKLTGSLFKYFTAAIGATAGGVTGLLLSTNSGSKKQESHLHLSRSF